jgi:hypothetical protein
MAFRIDWKRSLLFTAILMVVFYGLQYIIEDRDTYCMVTLVIFAAFFIIVNMVGRRR